VGAKATLKIAVGIGSGAALLNVQFRDRRRLCSTCSRRTLARPAPCRSSRKALGIPLGEGRIAHHGGGGRSPT